MSGLFKNTKLIGGILVVLVIAAVAYYYMGASSAPVATVTQASSPASQDLLAMLNNLRSIKLDASIFNDPLFMSLSDFGVTIPAEPTGRHNPFSPASPSQQQPTQTPGGTPQLKK